jgi:hypothetical protein
MMVWILAVSHAFKEKWETFGLRLLMSKPLGAALWQFRSPGCRAGGYASSLAASWHEFS